MNRTEVSRLTGRLLVCSLVLVGAACNYNYGPPPNAVGSNQRQRLKRLVYPMPFGIGVTTDYAYNQSGRVGRATYTGAFDYISNPCV